MKGEVTHQLDYLLKSVVSILKPSPISGVGFFAVRDIEKGEEIFTPWYGESGIYSISITDLFLLPEDLQKNIYETFDNKMFYLSKEGIEIEIKKEYGKLFFPLEKGFHWIYIWPKMFINSGLKNANVDTINYVNPKTLRKVYKGEELLANYGSDFKITPKNFI
jgi:hypothetical protein